MGIFDGGDIDPLTGGLLGATSAYAQGLGPSRLPINPMQGILGAIGGFGQGYNETQMGNIKQKYLQQQIESALTQNALAKLDLAYYQRQQPPQTGLLGDGGVTGARASNPIAASIMGGSVNGVGGLPASSPYAAGGGQLPQQAPAQGASGGNGMLLDPRSLVAQLQGAQSHPGGASSVPAILSFLEKNLPPATGYDVNGNLVPQPRALDTLSQIEGAKAEGAAPYKVLEALASQAGRPINMEANRITTTGAQALPPGVQSAIAQLTARATGGASGAPAASGGALAAGGASPPLGGSATPRGTGYSNTGQPFGTQPIRNPDGSLASPINATSLGLQEGAAKAYEKSGENYQSAQNLSGQLDLMDRNLDLLNQANWSSTGTGANLKMGAIKAMNSIGQTFGIGQPFDPEKVGTWESFNKESTRMGFELAKTLGSREAQMIVQQAISAVPNVENSYMGAKLVSSSLRQAAQRQMDYHEFLTSYANDHAGNTFGADVAFNKTNPPGQYAQQAVIGAIPPQAKQLLLSDPSLVSQFDAKYGKGIALKLLGTR